MSDYKIIVSINDMAILEDHIISGEDTKTIAANCINEIGKRLINQDNKSFTIEVREI